MPTIIDAFMVTFGLDPAAFKKGAAEVTKEQAKLTAGATASAKEIDQVEKKLTTAQIARGKELDAQAKHIADGFKKIRNEALGLLAIFTAGKGLKDFAVDTISTAAGLDRMSANLGMSAKDLSEWQLAAKHAGGSAEGMTEQIKQASGDIAQLKMGLGPSSSLQASIRYGATLSDLKDGNALLLKQADILKKLYDVDPTKAAQAAKLMNVSDAAFPLLRQGSAAVQAQRRAQAGLAEEMARAAKPAEELRQKFDSLENTFGSISVNLLTDLMPVFDRLVVYFQKLADWIAAHKQDIAGWVDRAVTSIAALVEQLDKGAESIGGWKTVLEALIALKIVSMIAPAIQLAAALAGVGTSLGVIGTVGTAALAVLAGLGIAKALGVPDTNQSKGIADIKSGKWFAASMDLPAADFVSALAGKAAGMSNEQIANVLSSRASAKNDGASDTSTIGAAAAGSGGDVAKRLMRMGWSREQAAGIAGSFIQESDLDPTKQNPVSGAYGIGQWLGSRVADFKKFSGKDLKGSSLEDQLAFFQYEVTRGNEKAAGDRLRAATTAADAARIHSQAYERPGDAEANIARRQRLAAQINGALQLGSATSTANLSGDAGATSRAASRNGGSTSTTDVKIGEINVRTAATDADGIARDVGGAMKKRFGYTLQANGGMI